MNTKGFQFEDEIVFRINDKQIKDLSPHQYYMIQELYGFLEDEEKVNVMNIMEFIKPDLIFTYKGEDKYVSVKCIRAESLHRENIFTFAAFLKEIGVSESTVNTILHYQFGDGTLDGTGDNPLPYVVLKDSLKEEIKAANEELENKEIVLKVMERVVFQGIDKYASRADALYIGNLRQGALILEHQMRRYIRNKDWSLYSGLHIGPFFLRPHARYINKEPKYKNFRFQIDISWPHLYEDVVYISKHYNSYIPKRLRDKVTY